MSATIKNVALLGATGFIGAPILKALLAEPSFNVTIISRTASTAQYPPNVAVKKVSDDFTVAELTEAFKDQDAVVVASATSSIFTERKDSLPYRLVDAAVAAGVKRFIPSDYGGDNIDSRVRSLVPIYEAKARNLEYLIEKAKESKTLTWTSVATGSWLDWNLDPEKSRNFFGFDIKNKKATIYDSGETRFSVTPTTISGIAVARILLSPETTANQKIFLSSFVTTPRKVLAALEDETSSKFEVEVKASKPVIADAKKQVAEGNLSGAYTLVLMSVVSDIDAGFDFEKEQKVWNKQLGLPEVTLESVISNAVAHVRNP